MISFAVQTMGVDTELCVLRAGGMERKELFLVGGRREAMGPKVRSRAVMIGMFRIRVFARVVDRVVGDVKGVGDIWVSFFGVRESLSGYQGSALWGEGVFSCVLFRVYHLKRYKMRLFCKDAGTSDMLAAVECSNHHRQASPSRSYVGFLFWSLREVGKL